MKGFLASCFLFIFSLQILPVKEIGKILLKGIMSEEVHEAECGCTGDDDGSSFSLDNPYTTIRYYSYSTKWVMLAGEKLSVTSPETYAKQFIPDIPTPPPDCC